jgi:hypothetical protein
MIVIDPIANYIRNGRPVRAAHLLSDQKGITGTKELFKFGMTIGLKAGWLQDGDTPHEHFDVMGKMIDAAIEAGAVRIDRYRLVEIIRKKRGDRRPNVRVRAHRAPTSEVSA